MKVISRSSLKTWGGTATRTLQFNEMEVLKSLDHRNIVKLHEIIDDPLKNKIYMIMDYLPGGTLADKLSRCESGLPEREVWQYFRDLISALHYCHEVKSLSHRDVKPENMMLSEEGNLVLCDFGVSQFFTSKRALITGMMGTMRFMAPECFKPDSRKKLSGKKLDIWAAGVTLYLLLTSKYPFGGDTQQEIERQTLTNDPPLAAILNEDARCLLAQMLQKDPETRIEVSLIIKDKWVSSAGADPLELNSSMHQSSISSELINHFI